MTLSETTEFPAGCLRVLVANQMESHVDCERLEQAVRWCLEGSTYHAGTVSIAIVSDSTIHELNLQFLQHDFPTDVLSFALEDAPPCLEGEIVVSLDAAARNAVDAGWEAVDELLLYVVHGALHLAGFQDENAASAAEMRVAEAAVLDRLNVRRSQSDPRWRTLPSARTAVKGSTQ